MSKIFYTLLPDKANGVPQLEFGKEFKVTGLPHILAASILQEVIQVANFSLIMDGILAIP
ncbi:hypothetical protein [Methylobacter psychrophilus]|uniref:hypothetical protein n=1 Tax=Methylobacter psychrophilus TaxID=96941 RepID=UPI0021D50697|nr:hypothetical protein [Methylobacter psychrophilus]